MQMELVMKVHVLDLSAYIGLTAVGAMTLNIFLGTLMVLRYSPVCSWPHRHFNYFRLHNRCGYIALFASALHPAILLANSNTKFTVMEILYPMHSPGNPVENTFGAVPLYVITLVVITSYFRVKRGRRLWKAFHFPIYFALAALFFHSALTAPDLKSESVDWLDGGKVSIMGCLILVAGTAFLRWCHSRARARERIDGLTGIRNMSPCSKGQRVPHSLGLRHQLRLYGA